MPAGGFPRVHVFPSVTQVLNETRRVEAEAWERRRVQPWGRQCEQAVWRQVSRAEFAAAATSLSPASWWVSP
eukprot:10000433-Lingulodinium_polyedra.AAC.1